MLMLCSLLGWVAPWSVEKAGKYCLTVSRLRLPFSLKVRERNVKNPNLHVVMGAVFLKSGNVMVMKTVQMAVMRVLVVSSQNNTSAVVLAS